MRDAFLKQLEELHKMLAEMGSLCEDMIDGTYEALMNMDRDQAAKILAADANVDLKERDIESKCLKLLLIFMDIREPDPLHLRFQEFPGIKFRLRSRCAVAKDRIALKFLHLLCEAVGISDIHCL